MSGDLPSIKEELDRKSLDAIERLILKHRDGEISDEAYSVALDVLFMTVSGLVSEDFIQLITIAGDEVDKTITTKSGDEIGLSGNEAVRREREERLGRSVATIRALGLLIWLRLQVATALYFHSLARTRLVGHVHSTKVVARSPMKLR